MNVIGPNENDRPLIDQLVCRIDPVDRTPTVDQKKLIEVMRMLNAELLPIVDKTRVLVRGIVGKAAQVEFQVSTPSAM